MLPLSIGVRHGWLHSAQTYPVDAARPRLTGIITYLFDRWGAQRAFKFAVSIIERSDFPSASSK